MFVFKINSSRLFYVDFFDTRHNIGKAFYSGGSSGSVGGGKSSDSNFGLAATFLETMLNEKKYSNNKLLTDKLLELRKHNSVKVGTSTNIIQSKVKTFNASSESSNRSKGPRNFTKQFSRKRNRLFKFYFKKETKVSHNSINVENTLDDIDFFNSSPDSSVDLLNTMSLRTLRVFREKGSTFLQHKGRLYVHYIRTMRQLLLLKSRVTAYISYLKTVNFRKKVLFNIFRSLNFDKVNFGLVLPSYLSIVDRFILVKSRSFAVRASLISRCVVAISGVLRRLVSGCYISPKFYTFLKKAKTQTLSVSSKGFAGTGGMLSNFLSNPKKPLSVVFKVSKKKRTSFRFLKGSRARLPIVPWVATKGRRNNRKAIASNLRIGFVPQFSSTQGSLRVRLRAFRVFLKGRRRRFAFFYLHFIRKHLRVLEGLGAITRKAKKTNNKPIILKKSKFELKFDKFLLSNHLSSSLKSVAFRSSTYPEVPTSFPVDESRAFQRALSDNRWMRLHYSRLLRYFHKNKFKGDFIGLYKKRFNFYWSKRKSLLSSDFLKPKDFGGRTLRHRRRFLKVRGFSKRVDRLSTLLSKERTLWSEYLKKFRKWFKLYSFLNKRRGYLNLWFLRAWSLYIKPWKYNTCASLFKKKKVMFKITLDYIQKAYSSGNVRSWRKAVLFRLIYLYLKSVGDDAFSYKGSWSDLKLSLLSHLDSIMLGSGTTKTVPVPYDSIHFHTALRERTPWRSRAFWNIKKHSSLFTRRRFQKRFHLFRVERVFRAKRSKRRKVKTLLEYSHSRFHKFRLFYTTLGYRQFQSIFKGFLSFKKNSLSSILAMLELRLEFFLYRVNFAPSKYFAKQLLKHRGVFVNGISVCNKNHTLSVSDVVFFSDDKFYLVYNTLLSRLRSVNNRSYLSEGSFGGSSKTPVIFSHPDYCEIDFSLLSATIIRLPRPCDVFVPNNIELDALNVNMHHIYNSYL